MGVQPEASARALRLEHLQVRSFRNLAPAAIDFHPRFNVFVGDNGQGKSNLLEAICMAGWQRSFRGASRDEMIAIGAEEARIEARVRKDSDPAHEIEIDLQRTGKTILLDGKRASPERYFAAVQMIVFHPGELLLIQGGPVERRVLLDRLLYQTDPAYPLAFREHQRALRSRNRLLRERAERSVIQAFDVPFCEASIRMMRAREQLIEELNPRVARAFAQISGGTLPLELRYRPKTPARSAAELEERLVESLERDRDRGVTSRGPQGDEMEIRLGGQPARSFASQGQARATVLALKCAELEVIEARSGQVPLLLLDDVSSELDPTRTGFLLQRLMEDGGQVILTTTDTSFLKLGEKAETRVVSGGSVQS